MIAAVQYADLVATGAFLVGAFALWHTVRVQRRMAIADTRASLRGRLDVEVSAVHGGKDWSLVLWNKGAGVARNVRLELDGEPAKRQRAYRGQEAFSSLAPDAMYRSQLVVHMQAAPPRSLRLTWDDDTGTGREWSTGL